MATSKERLAHAADIAGEMHDDDTNYCLAESIRRLLEATRVDAATRLTTRCEFEIEGQTRPALVADFILLIRDA